MRFIQVVVIIAYVITREKIFLRQTNKEKTVIKIKNKNNRYEVVCFFLDTRTSLASIMTSKRFHRLRRFVDPFLVAFDIRRAMLGHSSQVFASFGSSSCSLNVPTSNDIA